jgi:hypothetical protein
MVKNGASAPYFFELNFDLRLSFLGNYPQIKKGLKLKKVGRGLWSVVC